MIIKREFENGNIEVSFNEEDIDRTCWCFGEFYDKLNLIEEFKKYPDRADVKYIKCTKKTEEFVYDRIKDNFKLVTLRWLPEVKVIRYRKRRRKLTKCDENSIAMDYLSYSPSIDDSMEDMVIRFETK